VGEEPDAEGAVAGAPLESASGEVDGGESAPGGDDGEPAGESAEPPSAGAGALVPGFPDGALAGGVAGDFLGAALGEVPLGGGLVGEPP